MKRIILLIFFVALCFSLQAQHIKFHGIELGCTINNFQDQLQNKGFEYDSFSKNLPNGERWFKGKYLDENVTVMVDYRPSDQLVYKVSLQFVYTKETIVNLKWRLLEGLKKQFEEDFEKEKFLKDRISSIDDKTDFHCFITVGGTMTLLSDPDSIQLFYDDDQLKPDEEIIVF